MGWLDALKAFVSSVDAEYDRRIKVASNVKTYHVGGHGTHGVQPGVSVQPHVVERLEGEGGATGELQANAGQHLHANPETGAEHQE